MSLFDNISNAVSSSGNYFQSLQQELGSSITQSSVPVSNFLTTYTNGVVQNFSSNLNSLVSNATNPTRLLSKYRSRNLPFGAEQVQSQRATAEFSSTTHGDWRVKLSLPDSFENSPLLKPLNNTEGLVFPYTPAITVQHDANYDSLAPVHNNYPFPVYQGSSMQNITITGDFIVQNSNEARYWIAAMHYLRSITKMDYGQGGSGNPPPTVRLNGYGDFVFKNVPVIVTNFSIELPQDVDYIASQLENQSATNTDSLTNAQGTERTQNSGMKNAFSYVPAVSTISVTLQVVYSRSDVEQFNMKSFIQGDYLNGKGFI